MSEEEKAVGLILTPADHAVSLTAEEVSVAATTTPSVPPFSPLPPPLVDLSLFSPVPLLSRQHIDPSSTALARRSRCPHTSPCLLV